MLGHVRWMLLCLDIKSIKTRIWHLFSYKLLILLRNKEVRYMEVLNNNILLVEDSDEDYYITCRAFKKSGLGNNILRCVDGEDALDYLNRRGKYQDKKKYPWPNMILLDLNLPKKDGREVLQIIKTEPSLKEIPVIVLTTSSNEKDIAQCYLNGANSYIKKPVDFENFMKAVQTLKDYWFEIVVLPKRESA